MTQSITNTLRLGFVVTGIVVSLAFLFAFGLTRTCIPFKPAFKVLGMLPILAPSLLPAISMIYLFGHQGIARELLLGHSVYGLPGIVLGLVFWTFPTCRPDSVYGTVHFRRTLVRSSPGYACVAI